MLIQVKRKQSKATKKKANADVDVKNKASTNKSKATATIARKTRGRKNGATVEDTSKDDDESKVTEGIIFRSSKY